MIDVSNRSRLDLSRVEATAKALIEALAQVLSEQGLDAQRQLLPLLGDGQARVSDESGLRALTMGFHLLSIAEQHAATRYREQAERCGQVESGLWASTLAELSQRPGLDHALAQLEPMRIEPVFTAHPTEARRISALEQWLELFCALPADVDQAPAQPDLLARLERLLRAGEVRLRKPTLCDERATLIHTLTSVVAPALAQVEARTAQALQALPEAAQVARHSLRLSTWVGGDRDGHPGVTPQVTARSLVEYRAAALALHRQTLTGLLRALAISQVHEPTPAPLAQAIERGVAALRQAGELQLAQDILARNPEEPARVLLALMLARLPDSPAALDGERPTPPRHASFAQPQDLERELLALHHGLTLQGAARLARAHVEPALALVRALGFHLVTVDLRQNSAAHDRALEALGLQGFASMPEAQRVERLRHELSHERPFTMPGVALPAEAELAVGPLRVVAQHTRRWGAQGVGSLIISMTRDLSDLLAPLVLAKEAGLLVQTPEGLACPLPIVPLFETLDDLERSPQILARYLEEPIVRRSLARRALDGDPVQQIMLGYSDSNKDAGPCASLWAVHVAQRELLAVAKRAGVGLQFFHGRGGSSSRGAGPTHRFLAATPSGAVARGLRATEQGETIFQKYGTVQTAAYNLELLVAGAFRRQVLDALHATSSSASATAEQPAHALAQAMDQVALASRQAYQALLAEPDLVTFFRHATPVDVLEQSAIGSRPSRRTGQATLADLRAIPWVFAWSQSRYALTGWYGLGHGLERLAAQDPERFELLRAQALTWGPMRYLISSASQAVMTADPELMRAYAALVPEAQARQPTLDRALDELARTRRWLEVIYGAPLEQARQRVYRLLAMRMTALRAAHLRQIELLMAWRQGQRQDDALRLELLGTVNAIAAGLRTTG